MRCCAIIYANLRDHVERVNTWKKIKLDGSVFQVFLKPDEKYEHLQTYICEQTSVVAESQILLYKDKLMLTEINDNTLGMWHKHTNLLTL